MATVHRSKKSGLTRIQFIDPDGDRKTITLGRCPIKLAEKIASRVDALVVALFGNVSLDPETAAWLDGLRPRMRAKLAAVGLLQQVAPDVPRTLRAFIDWYVKERTGADVKPSTIIVWRRTQSHLVAAFDPEKPLAEFTTGDAKDFRRYLLRVRWQVGATETDPGIERKFSENTIRRTCGIAKQLFAEAVDRRLLRDNPFKHRDVPTMTEVNRERSHFITPEVAEQVLAALPDAQWRLLFALSRYAGLRCPSEHLALRWRDVDFAGERITIRAPKTEHHAGKGVRIIPLFPELRPYLEDAFDPEATFVITKYRDRNANLRTGLLRYMERAGIPSWPKLFNNLRSSRQTELEKRHPTHVVCYWMGNSPKVARDHYLQTTEEDYELALRARCTDSPQDPAQLRESAVTPSKAAEISQDVAPTRRSMVAEGLEPPTSWV